MSVQLHNTFTCISTCEQLHFCVHAKIVKTQKLFVSFLEQFLEYFLKLQIVSISIYCKIEVLVFIIFEIFHKIPAAHWSYFQFLRLNKILFVKIFQS